MRVIKFSTATGGEVFANVDCIVRIDKFKDNKEWDQWRVHMTDGHSYFLTDVNFCDVFGYMEFADRVHQG